MIVMEKMTFFASFKPHYKVFMKLFINLSFLYIGTPYSYYGFEK